jgi:hypothetical protein
LRGEKQGKRHVPYLVLQLFNPIDMCILIVEIQQVQTDLLSELRSPKSGFCAGKPIARGIRFVRALPGENAFHRLDRAAVDQLR